MSHGLLLNIADTSITDLSVIAGAMVLLMLKLISLEFCFSLVFFSFFGIISTAWQTPQNQASCEIILVFVTILISGNGKKRIQMRLPVTSHFAFLFGATSAARFSFKGAISVYVSYSSSQTINITALASLRQPSPNKQMLRCFSPLTWLNEKINWSWDLDMLVTESRIQLNVYFRKKIDVE